MSTRPTHVRLLREVILPEGTTGFRRFDKNSILTNPSEALLEAAGQDGYENLEKVPAEAPARTKKEKG